MADALVALGELGIQRGQRLVRGGFVGGRLTGEGGIAFLEVGGLGGEFGDFQFGGGLGGLGIGAFGLGAAQLQHDAAQLAAEFLRGIGGFGGLRHAG